MNRIIVIFALLLLPWQGNSMASPVIQLSTDLLKFGYVSQGGQHSRDFLIYNVGDETLDVDSVYLLYNEFTLQSPALPAYIEPGDSAIATIIFNPTSEQLFEGDLVIYSNDPVNSQLPLAFQANGTRSFQPGEIIWEFAGNDNVNCVTAIPDVNDDGFPDVVAEIYWLYNNDQHLFCLSGSGDQQTETIWSGAPQGDVSHSSGWGDKCLATVADLNGDGTDDLLLSTAWGNRTLFAIDPFTGTPIWYYDTHTFPPSGWIYQAVDMGDLNGDGISEILGCAGSDADAGFLLDGATGTRIWNFQANDAVLGVDRISDVDDDGVADALLAAGDVNEDRAFCISGASNGFGQMIWFHDTNGGIIYSITHIGDLNNDGYEDAILGTWYNGNPVIAVSGHSQGAATVLWSQPMASNVVKVLASPDLNSDGLEDVLVGSSSQYVLALSGEDGEEIWRFWTRAENGGYVWTLDLLPDMNDDGVPEILAGSFDGYIYCLSGVDGQLVWETYTGNRLYTVRRIGDVNGDGQDDAIAGTQLFGYTGGRVYLISGGTTPTGISDEDQLLPWSFEISAYPNPFNRKTKIAFNLMANATAKLAIFNLNGQLVRSFEVYGRVGTNEIVWDGTDNNDNIVSSGIYFARIRQLGSYGVVKMTLLK